MPTQIPLSDFSNVKDANCYLYHNLIAIKKQRMTPNEPMIYCLPEFHNNPFLNEYFCCHDGIKCEKSSWLELLFSCIYCLMFLLSCPCSPIFAEIVPEKARTSIYALDRSFESVLSSFAPPVVGILAERLYGYKPISYGTSVSSSVETDRENAASLAKALYTAIAFPMTLCCFIYSFLYCTYPRDRERARMHSLITSEMQQIELDNAHGVLGESSAIQLSEMEINGNQRGVINVLHGEEDFETDDNDERILLSHNVA